MTKAVTKSSLILTLLLGLWIAPGAPVSAQTSETADSAQSDETSDEAQAAAFEITEMALGDENAPITMIEYASFTCSHCGAFHENTFKKLKADYIDTGKVRFIYREVYFDRFGLWGSMIARCAGPDRFFGVVDLIYKGQSDWTRAGGPAEVAEELRKIGRIAGLDNETLEACLTDADMAQSLVTWYQANAEEHEITGTPSFIINDTKVPNQSYDDLKKVLDAELGG